MEVTNKTPEYFARHPFGQVPLLDTPNGPLFESNTIARFIAREGTNKTIYGTNNYETSLIDQWLDVTRSLEPHITGWMYPLRGHADFEPAVIARSKANTLKFFNVLNAHLKGKKFVMGNHVTLADICLFCTFINPMKTIISPTVRATYSALNEWFTRCSNEPNFKEITGDIPLCTVEPTEPPQKTK